MKKINYYVIGGQYESVCYGGTPALIGAKRLANKNIEYWDNWQGCHTPRIYAADDTELIASNGSVTHYEGELIRVPKMGVEPVI